MTGPVVDNDGGSTKGHDPNANNGNTKNNNDNNNKATSSSSSTTRRKGRRRPLADQRFSAYLSFGLQTTICMSIFLFCYALLLLLLLLPLLNYQEPINADPSSTHHHHHRGQVLRPVVQQAMEKIKHGAERLRHPGAASKEALEGSKHLAQNVATAIQQKIASFRHDQGVTDASLLNEAVVDMNKLRRDRRQQKQQQQQLRQVNLVPWQNENNNNNQGAAGAAVSNKPRSGFVVLGMHRSGTSMLSGLMATGMGYKTGGPLIGSAFDNEKGFFELVPAVLQNDEFMNKQRIWWSAGVIDYDYQKALEDKEMGRLSFDNGRRALAVLNSPDQVPFLQKDPRMCITLKTWLPLLNSEPAVLFTYRHPLEVAKSLQRRENSFTLEHGLRLWIVYNMRGVQNSQNLCRITTSNEDILANPLQEVNRISQQLTQQCHVPAPPEPTLSQASVEKFVDSGLQHAGAQQAAADAHRNVLTMHNDGKCQVYEYDSDFTAEDHPNSFAREMDLYLKAMKIYCDFQSGEAYKPDYQWPKLN